MSKQIEVAYLNKLVTFDFPKNFEDLKQSFKDKFFLNNFKYNNMIIECYDTDGDKLEVFNEDSFLNDDAQNSKKWALTIIDKGENRKNSTTFENKLLTKKQEIVEELENYKKNLFKESCAIMENKIKEKNKEHEEKINKIREEYIENLKKVKSEAIEKTKELLEKMIKNASEILKEKLTNLNDSIKDELKREAENTLNTFQTEIEKLDFKEISENDSKIKNKIEQAKTVFRGIFERVSKNQNDENN